MFPAGGLAAARRSVLKGSARGPPKGALIIATERKTSGRINEDHAATVESASWPKTPRTDR